MGWGGSSLLVVRKWQNIIEAHVDVKVCKGPVFLGRGYPRARLLGATKLSGVLEHLVVATWWH